MTNTHHATRNTEVLVQPGSPGAAGQRTNGGHITLSPAHTEPAGRASYLASFITAGYVVREDGEPSNWLIPAPVLEAAAPMFEGLACYLDHPKLFGFGMRAEPQVRDLFGVTSHAMYDPVAQAIVGRITLYDQDPNSPGAFVGHLLDQMLEDQEKANPSPTLACQPPSSTMQSLTTTPARK